MPHLFLPRSRRFSITAEDVGTNANWERFNTFAYLLGGLILTFGSVCFLPSNEFEIDTGYKLYLWGSVLYLIVSKHDLAEVLACKEFSKHYRLDMTASANYILGSISYVAASVLYLSNFNSSFGCSVCLILGSILYQVGALLNAMQIFDASSIWEARLMLLTALFYILGSTLYIVGSVPSLFEFEDESDEGMIQLWSGTELILGSLFFFWGGSVNYVRAQLVIWSDWAREVAGQNLPETQHLL